MENNDIQLSWKKLGSEVTSSSKEELDRVLSARIKQAINHYLIFIVASALISSGFLLFLLITMMNRWGDMYYRINNMFLCVLTLFALITALGSILRIRRRNYNAPIKKWLAGQIASFDRWIKSRMKYYFLVILFIPTLLSIHVYFAEKPFMEALKQEESVWGLIFGTVIGLAVSFLVLNQIKRQHQKALGYLKVLYKQMES